MCVEALEAVVTDQEQQHQELQDAVHHVETAQSTPGVHCPPPHTRRGTGDDDTGDADHDSHTTMHKMEFPKFDDTSDPLLWLNRCERFFHVRRMTRRWHSWLSTCSTTPNSSSTGWNSTATASTQFVQLINARFGPLLTDNPINELAMLWRSGTVDEFCKHFIVLFYRDTSLTEQQYIQLFITGLGDPLWNDVALQQPGSLDDTIIFAHAYD
jgi:hypothetical protein